MMVDVFFLAIFYSLFATDFYFGNVMNMNRVCWRARSVDDNPCISG